MHAQLPEHPAAFTLLLALLPYLVAHKVQCANTPSVKSEGGETKSVMHLA